MDKDTKTDVSEQARFVQHLDELVRSGVPQMIEQAVHAELQQLLGSYGNVRLLDGRRAVVRNGYLPERQVLTGAGGIVVCVHQGA